MAAKTARDLKPAQVMLAEGDRELQLTLKRRLLDLGLDAAGPTTLYRAGLRALVEGDDKALVRAIDRALANCPRSGRRNYAARRIRHGNALGA
jgi:hypothetical protein